MVYLPLPSNLGAPGENVNGGLTLCINGVLMNDFDYILKKILELDCSSKFYCESGSHLLS